MIGIDSKRPSSPPLRPGATARRIANPNLAPVVALFDRGFSFSASNFGHGGAGPWAGCYDHPVEELAPAMCGGFSYPAFLHRLQEKAPALAGGG